jgi:hypothetical protein
MNSKCHNHIACLEWLLILLNSSMKEKILVLYDKDSSYVEDTYQTSKLNISDTCKKRHYMRIYWGTHKNLNGRKCCLNHFPMDRGTKATMKYGVTNIASRQVFNFGTSAWSPFSFFFSTKNNRCRMQLVFSTSRKSGMQHEVDRLAIGPQRRNQFSI